jgi:hypothetical protein
MPKINNTYDERKQKLYERITPEHIFNSTSIAKNPIGDKPLDPYTVEHIKRQYQIYFNSWIKEDAEAFLLNNKK